MPAKEALRVKADFLRSPVARGLSGKQPIVRDGGDYKAGLIREFAVCTRGEALGHEFWIDAHFLQQVAAAINGSRMGQKSRFTHPGLSSDGMGKMLGRSKNAFVDGDVVRADLHFNEAAHKTPDGDLAGYVMDLGEEDPNAFGTSIVFVHDEAAEMEFEAQHTGSEGFKSPDANNAENLPHVRLKALRAVDAVDDPAANPAGLFQRESDFVGTAWGAVRFALGLSDEAPQAVALDVDPTRVRAFVARFLHDEGLKIVPIGQAGSNDTQLDAGNCDAVPATQQAAKTGQDFLDAFGNQGGIWFAEGKTFAECGALEMAFLKAENAELKKRIAQVRGGEVIVPQFQATAEKQENSQADKLAMALGPRLGRFAAGIKFAPARSDL